MTILRALILLALLAAACAACAPDLPEGQTANFSCMPLAVVGVIITRLRGRGRLRHLPDRLRPRRLASMSLIPMTRGEAKQRLADREREHADAIAAVHEIGYRAIQRPGSPEHAELLLRAEARRKARRRVIAARQSLARWNR